MRNTHQIMSYRRGRPLKAADLRYTAKAAAAASSSSSAAAAAAAPASSSSLSTLTTAAAVTSSSMVHSKNCKTFVILLDGVHNKLSHKHLVYLTM